MSLEEQAQAAQIAAALGETEIDPLGQIVRAMRGASALSLRRSRRPRGAVRCSPRAANVPYQNNMTGNTTTPGLVLVSFHDRL